MRVWRTSLERCACCCSTATALCSRPTSAISGAPNRAAPFAAARPVCLAESFIVYSDVDLVVTAAQSLLAKRCAPTALSTLEMVANTAPSRCQQTYHIVTNCAPTTRANKRISAHYQSIIACVAERCDRRARAPLSLLGATHLFIITLRRPTNTHELCLIAFRPLQARLSRVDNARAGTLAIISVASGPSARAAGNNEAATGASSGRARARASSTRRRRYFFLSPAVSRNECNARLCVRALSDCRAELIRPIKAVAEAEAVVPMDIRARQLTLLALQTARWI